MKYAVWFVRLVFAAWMIPAGLNHFVPIFPQPMGSQPLSHELIVALIDSHLFDLVKAVELIAGIAVLTGFYAPLAVLLCMPVSFCVFWWDAPLEGWGSRAARFGYAALLANLLLCVAYVGSYRSMFAIRVTPRQQKQLFLAARVVLGAWMLANGLNHFFLGAWPEPAGQQSLAVQLMTAFSHSGLIGVAMAIELVTGALILAGVLLPVALCVLMPVSTCALYWALVLDHQPLGALLALVAFALNAMLMLGCLDHYRGALRRHDRTLGEASSPIFESVYAGAGARTSRGEYIPAALTLLATVGFYVWLVAGRSGRFSLLVLVYPGLVLLARRLRDQGIHAGLVLIPGLLMVAAFAIWLKYLSFGAQLDGIIPPAALAVSAAFLIWGALPGRPIAAPAS